MLLWMAAQLGFGFFLEKISELSVIYGSLTGLVVLVVWVYYASTILLVACCVVRSFNFQVPETVDASEPSEDVEPMASAEA